MTFIFKNKKSIFKTKDEFTAKNFIKFIDDPNKWSIKTEHKGVIIENYQPLINVFNYEKD